MTNSSRIRSPSTKFSGADRKSKKVDPSSGSNLTAVADLWIRIGSALSAGIDSVADGCCLPERQRSYSPTVSGDERSPMICRFGRQGKSATRDVTDGGDRLLNKCSDLGFWPASLSSPSTTMSSLRHHRVIIASLFLPNTTILGDSAPPSPRDESVSPTPAFVPPTPGAARQPLLSRPSVPLKSIVEDLRDKVSTCHN